MTNSGVTGVPSGHVARVGDVPLQPGHGAGLGLQRPVHRPGAAGQLDEPVSAVLPSKVLSIKGNPDASVNRPMVICGSHRRSLENPGSRNPSPTSVSKYRVDTS